MLEIISQIFAFIVLGMGIMSIVFMIYLGWLLVKEDIERIFKKEKRECFLFQHTGWDNEGKEIGIQLIPCLKDAFGGMKYCNWVLTAKEIKNDYFNGLNLIERK